MYKILIERIEEEFDYTLGKAKLIKDKQKLMDFYTLEPRGPDCQIPEQNMRIPEGVYDTEWVDSSKSGVQLRGKLPVLFNNIVSKDRKILMHIGNTYEDTRGCILVGLYRGTDRVLESKKCLDMLFNIIFNEHFIVEIKNNFN